MFGFRADKSLPQPVEAICSDRNGDPFLVREGLESDGPQLYLYKTCIFTETELLLQAPEDFESDPEREALFLRRFQASQNSLYLLAIKDEAIVGTLSLFGGPYRRTRHVAQLGMGVLQGWWDLGIGTALMEQALIWPDSNPYLEKVSLHVYDTNHRAIHIYDRKGFTREGILQGDVRLDDGTKVNLVVMSIFLSDEDTN